MNRTDFSVASHGFPATARLLVLKYYVSAMHSDGSHVWTL